MAKFFRKIRLSFLNPEKASGYILYAIGEIVLVVIGILIALQINNWSEEYKDRKLEQSYYCRLLEDTNQDNLLLDKLIEENQVRINASNRLIHLLQQAKPERREVIAATRACISQIRFRFRPSTSAFDDIKSSGKLQVLKDLAVKKQLLSYYASMEAYGDISDINANSSLAVYNNPAKDFFEIGMQELDFVKGEIDSTLVDVDKLKSQSFPTGEIRRQLLSDAMMYLYSNARKKANYELMRAEILTMKEMLNLKCISE